MIEKTHKRACNIYPAFRRGWIFFTTVTFLFSQLPGSANDWQEETLSENFQKLMCGAASLSLLCEMSGVSASVEEIAQLVKTDEAGTTLKDLANAAYKLGLNAAEMKIDIGKLLRMQRPVIVHVRQNDYVVVEIITDSQLRLFNPRKPTSIVTPVEFSKIWDGHVLIVSPQESIQGNQPDVEIEKPIFDFGEAGQEEIISHKFVIKNVGDALLEIKSVSQSCVYTATIASSSIVPPGGGSQILAEYDTKHVRGKQAADIAIYTNDPDEPVTFATMKGIVVGLVRVSPSYLYLSEVRSRQAVHKAIKVYDPGHGRLRVKKVRTSTPFLQTNIHEQSKGALVATIDVTLQPGLPLGDINEEIVIETNEGKSPETEVLVKGKIVGDLKLSPKQFFFGYVKPGDIAE